MFRGFVPWALVLTIIVVGTVAGGNDPSWKEGLKSNIDSVLKDSENVKKNSGDMKFRNMLAESSAALDKIMEKSKIDPRISQSSKKTTTTTPKPGKSIAAKLIES